jgi:hypothetical protein
MQAKEAYLPWSILQKELNQLSIHMQTNDVAALIEQLKNLVSGFKPDLRHG